MLRGVLLEGLNFAGKSTTAARLTTLLRARGTEVHSRHCYVCDTEGTQTLQLRAKSSIGGSTGRPVPDPDLLRPFNAMKSAQMLIDSELAMDSVYAAGPEGPVLVQDRHWFTQYCNNGFFNPGEGYLSDSWVLTCAPRFTVQVYLTCSPAERERRAGRRDGDAHGLNAYLRANPKGIAALDTFCIEQIADDPSWIVVATDDLSQDEIAAHLLGLFDARHDAVVGAVSPPTPSRG
jgi:thymidylate kinase